MDEDFVTLLRSHLKYAGESPIADESNLRDLGLDSMRSIELLFAVEDAYGVVLPDEHLTDTTFDTPQRLWTVLEQLRAGADRGI
ncbi:MAG: acyl carrier protein [Jatrophihabitans sp.]